MHTLDLPLPPGTPASHRFAFKSCHSYPACLCLSWWKAPCPTSPRRLIVPLFKDKPQSASDIALLAQTGMGNRATPGHSKKARTSLRPRTSRSVITQCMETGWTKCIDNTWDRAKFAYCDPQQLIPQSPARET